MLLLLCLARSFISNIYTVMDPEGDLSLFDNLKMICDIITDHLPDMLNSKIVLLFDVDHLPHPIMASIGIDTMIILEEWDISSDFVTSFVNGEDETEQRRICFSDLLECIYPPTPSNNSDNEIENITKAEDVIDNVRFICCGGHPKEITESIKASSLPLAEIIERIYRGRHAPPSP